MKGIILAGGLGTRLYPLTISVSKHLLPVFDKPMIYYPLATLMMAGIKEILIIATSRDLPLFKLLLGNGEHLGIDISYALQDKPNGLAEALIIGEDFIQNEKVVLILGDNIFAGIRVHNIIQKALHKVEPAIIFGYPMKDPRPYGVIQLDRDGQIIGLEEKPDNPLSNYIVPGLYIYDSTVVKIAKKVIPSSRGELEITSINQEYLSQGKLKVQLLHNDITWFDAGDFPNLIQASRYVEKVQKNSGSYVSCVEEVAYRMGYISKEQLIKNADDYGITEYSEYLYSLAKENILIEE